MSVSIVDVSPASDSEWDSCWEGCDFATYFHSREWMETWRRLDAGGARLEPRRFIFSDGKRAIVPMSTTLVHRGMVKVHSLGAAGGYGGWLSTDALNDGHARLLAQYLVRLGSIDWLTSPCDPLVSTCGVFSGKADETHVVALDDEIEVIARKWTKGHRSAIQKALRSGVSIRKAGSTDDLRTYFDIYRDSVKRWGESATSDYRYEIFESLCALNSRNITLWLAMYDGSAIAGAVCLYSKKHVSYWHGAALGAHFVLRPVNLLLRHAMNDARERGIEWFDLGMSGGHEGVRSFKKSFGADAVATLVVSEKSRWHRMIEAVARLKDQVSGSLPLTGSSHTGR